VYGKNQRQEAKGMSAKHWTEADKVSI